MKKIALLLAGGKGTRLWPLSRENYPKQFVPLNEGRSLFQNSLGRLLDFFESTDLYTVASENYKFIVRNQIDLFKIFPRSDRSRLLSNAVFEPAAKNTLWAVLLALKSVEAKRRISPTDLVYVFACDHVIYPRTQFTERLRAMTKNLQQGKIGIFGVRPVSASKEYGYVLAGRGNKAGATGLPVLSFREKPSSAAARRLVERSAYWNAGIFCFHYGTLLKELERYQPVVYKAYTQKSLEDFIRVYQNAKPLSFDCALMEKTKNAVVVPLGLHWSDLASWDHFLKAFGPKQGNSSIGQAKFIDTKNSFAYSRDKLVCMVGLRDVLAVDSADALLVMRRGQANRVKDLVASMNREGLTHNKDGTTVHRPWGYYTILHEGPGYKVKEIAIYPKRSLSLQKHFKRSEHWNIVEGEVDVRVGRARKIVRKNESVFVPPNTKHRIANSKAKTAKIIEVQIGSYLGEDDIVRYSRYL